MSEAVGQQAGRGGDRAPGHARAHHEGGTTTRAEGGWASAGVMFAGVLMLVLGVLHMIQGIAGIAANDVYAVVGEYVFEFSTIAWGWIHLVLGVILVVVGGGILGGATWARAGGVALTALAIVANFVWLPYQPVWGIVSIAVALFVIWALCTVNTTPTTH